MELLLFYIPTTLDLAKIGTYCDCQFSSLLCAGYLLHSALIPLSQSEFDIMRKSRQLSAALIYRLKPAFTSAAQSVLTVRDAVQMWYSFCFTALQRKTKTGSVLSANHVCKSPPTAIHKQIKGN